VALPPIVHLFLPVAQPREPLRHRFAEVLRIIKIPFADPSPDPTMQADKPKPIEPLVTKPKATLRGCQVVYGPFVDQKADNDTKPTGRRNPLLMHLLSELAAESDLYLYAMKTGPRYIRMLNGMPFFGQSRCRTGSSSGESWECEG
jgi:hypothetical protein